MSNCFVKKLFKCFKKKKQFPFPKELSSDEIDLLRYIKNNDLSMVSYQRLCATLLACKHAIESKIPGDFVECGVWRGGNALIAAWMFKKYQVNKKVYLFDTFQGMTKPSKKDQHLIKGNDPMQKFLDKQKDSHNEWCYASLEDVKSHFKSLELLSDHIFFIQGDVELTLAQEQNLPKQISVLRLDTDWYASTYKELNVLYPLLANGGTLIIDDYGTWKGSKDAVDQYFNEHPPRLLFQFTDDSGRMATKF